MWTIFRKELADHFSSMRFAIMLALIIMVSVVTAYMVGTGLRDQLSGHAMSEIIFLYLFTSSGGFFSLADFVAIFGPLIGLILGFDAINRERNQGTLSKLVSQPILRDSIINGKFLAGVATVAIMLLALLLMISGLGLCVLGVAPGPDEVGRLLIYLVISIFYISFWMGVAILFSILLRSTASSALASLAVWIFFSFFVAFGASLTANAIAPIDDPQNMEAVMANQKLTEGLSLVSPLELYNQSTTTLLDPMRKTTQSMVLSGRF
jgi:ABC-2 type transport system permease protein